MMGLELATPRLQTECSSSKTIAGKELSLSSWCIASLYFYHFSTVIDFSSEKYSGGTGHRNHCISRMRSQSQLRNDKNIMMQYTNWINSIPSQQ